MWKNFKLVSKALTSQVYNLQSVTHKSDTVEQRETGSLGDLKLSKGEPLESVCFRAGTGSCVLNPFPSVIVASLHAVDHRCCTPLYCNMKS